MNEYWYFRLTKYADETDLSYLQSVAVTLFSFRTASQSFLVNCFTPI